MHNPQLELWKMAFGREIQYMTYGNMALERATKDTVALGHASNFSKARKYRKYSI